MIDVNEQLASGIELLEKLHDHGHKAFFVGGFVRDRLLGMPTDDIDITTDATPAQVAGIFPEAKPTGIKYGTVTVQRGSFTFEITTFRSESHYLDHRHPEKISFAANLEDDLRRRDFTINAIAMTNSLEIIDPYSGRDDLKRRLIRAIGNPKERFREDALRILRAFRFVSKMDFEFEAATAKELTASASLLEKIANERIIGEFRKIINYPHALKAFRLLHQLGIGSGIKTLETMFNFMHGQKRFSLSEWEFYALAFHLDGLSEIPHCWRFSNKQKSIVTSIMTLAEVTKADRFDEVLVYAYGLDLCLAANNVNRTLDPGNDQEQRIRTIWENLPIRKVCELKFKGEDILKTTAITDVRQIGAIIDEVVMRVVTGQLENTYEAIAAWVDAYGKTNSRQD